MRGVGDALMGGTATFNLFDARLEVSSLFLFPERGSEETGASLVDDVEAGMKGRSELEPSAAFNLFDTRLEVSSPFLFPERGLEETSASLVDDAEAGGSELEPLGPTMSLSTTAVGSDIAREGLGVTGREAKWRCEDGGGERRGVNGRGVGGEERGVAGHDEAGEGGREGAGEG